jgi:hypothetical protein
MAREKDTRRIISGVQLLAPDAGGPARRRKGSRQGGATFRTFHSEADLDALEELMTPEQCEYLKEVGAIEGDWSPRGTPAAPMQGSPLHKEGLRRQEEARGQTAGPAPEPEPEPRAAPPAGEPAQPPPDVSPRPEEVALEARPAEEAPPPEPQPPPEEDTGKGRGRKRGW